MQQNKVEIEKKKKLLNFFYNIELISIKLNNEADCLVNTIKNCKKRKRKEIKKLKLEYYKIIRKLNIIDRILKLSDEKLLKLKLVNIIKKLYR